MCSGARLKGNEGPNHSYLHCSRIIRDGCEVIILTILLPFLNYNSGLIHAMQKSVSPSYTESLN